jgi:hypothetical protein
MSTDVTLTARPAAASPTIVVAADVDVAVEGKNLLPWERAGSAEGVGICLSGGGIRAASFALGAVQALQQQRGLLFGPRSADYLAVVSGGSYVGACLTLNAAALAANPAAAADPPPCADGSPEAAHIVANGEYLRHGGRLRTALRFVIVGVLNVAAFFAIFVWTGTLLATWAYAATEVSDGRIDAASGVLVWPLAGLGVIGGAIILRGIYKDGGVARWLLPLLGIAIVIGCAPSLISAMERVSPLSDATWWTTWWRPALFFGTAVGLAAVWWAALKLVGGDIGSNVAHVVARVAVVIPRLAGVVMLSLVTTYASGRIGRATGPDVTNFDPLGELRDYFAVLVGGLVFSAVVARVSLHRIYREQLSQPFAVRRVDGAVTKLAPTEARLATLTPPTRGDARSFPRLLVSATANVAARWPDGKRRGFAPFVFSHDRCGIPGVAGASIETARLESRSAPAGLLTWSEPLLSLMSSVAATGAAISPSMGMRTIPALRAFIAIVNIRLGRWLPNPLSMRIRREILEGPPHGPPWWDTQKRHVGLGGGFDEFLPELLGLHRADAPRIYVSDGGHYDNLGLLALLRARCATIWCVDSEADKRGRAHQLQQVVRLALAELNVAITIDFDEFVATDGIMGTTHAVGTIDYGEGQSGKLIVIKLGLMSSTPDDLRDRRQTDHAFPYHSTFRYVAYRADRLDAYRRLGIINATAAMAAAQ